MRIIGFILLLLPNLLFNSSFSQEWQVIPASFFSEPDFNDNPSYNYRCFKISPYDNSIWMTRFQSYSKIRSISDQGIFTEYNYINDPGMPQTFQFFDFEFAAGKTFAINEVWGLYTFDGNGWTQNVAVDDCISIVSDHDTLWVPRSNNQNFLVWENGAVSYGSASFKKMAAKNGNYWVRTSDYTGIKSFRQGVVSMPYSPDTSLILSWNNYDFKFANNSDSLFVASEKGISIAVDRTFVDSITPGNSSNMPAEGVIEFEFDDQDNIWAIFQADHISSPTHVAFYNRQTNDWEQIYDSSNSPIDFTYDLTIEIDTNGNVWLSNGFNLYVLKINNWPGWLEAKELTHETIVVYPNPARNEVQFENDGIAIKSIDIMDGFGNLLKSMDHIIGNKIDVSKLSKGVYFLRINDKSSSRILKLVKE